MYDKYYNNYINNEIIIYFDNDNINTNPYYIIFKITSNHKYINPSSRYQITANLISKNWIFNNDLYNWYITKSNYILEDNSFVTISKNELVINHQYIYYNKLIKQNIISIDDTNKLLPFYEDISLQFVSNIKNSIDNNIKNINISIDLNINTPPRFGYCKIINNNEDINLPLYNSYKHCFNPYTK